MALTGIGALPSVPGVLRFSGGEVPHDHLAPSLSALPRYDLIPLSDEIPADGIIFARIRSNFDSLVVFRTPEERLRNPERLNLDRRQLDICPLLEQEQRLRLLNFQNNNIRAIQNIENLPNLIFLDLYNNKLASLEGPVSSVKGLRVLMAGKNRITLISNLTNLRKLDVLDLHSNEISVVEGLEGLSDLRVLNLAGNRISMVQNLSSLQALTELNLRRNNIEKVLELDKLPSLQRVFLSHNHISSFNDMTCLFNVKFLIELSLDGNPMSDSDPVRYRNRIIGEMSGLRHLDLKRITDEERVLAIQINAAARELEIAEAEAASAAALAALTATNSNLISNETLGGGGGMDGSVSNGGTLFAMGGADENWRSSAGFANTSNSAALPFDTLPWSGMQDENNGGSISDNFERDQGDSDHGAGQAPSGVQVDMRGLAALARAGRVSSSHNLFDLEVRKGKRTPY